MGHIGSFEAPQDMGDGVHFPDVAQELIPEALPFGGPPHEPRDVHELDEGGNSLLRPCELVNSLSLSSGIATRPTFGSTVQNG